MPDWQWYYAPGSVQQGPVSTPELQRLLASGQIPPKTNVWREGMGAWMPAANVQGLIPLPPAAPAGYAPAPPPAYPHGYAPPAVPLGYMPPPHRSAADDPGLRWLVPVGRSAWAIAAGYLGLLSFILFPAPLALIVSLVAISQLRKNPHLHGMGRAVFGLVMGILGTLVLGAALLAAA